MQELEAEKEQRSGGDIRRLQGEVAANTKEYAPWKSQHP